MFENIDITGLSHMIHQKEVKPSEVISYFCTQAEKSSQLNAFNFLNAESAMEYAKELDKQPITPETSALFGIPIAVKDNICTMDMPTTCSSKMLQNFRPTFDATAVTRLRSQGAVLFGKTNMDEFGASSGSDNSIFGRVSNPYNTNISADGSAVAVAANIAPISLASDTGGSIRKPAALCNLVGYKPTRGAVSRYGLIGYSGSFDQIGVLARSVSDAALIMTVIGGHDAKDATSNPNFSFDISKLEALNIKGKKIGIVDEYCTDVMSVAKKYEALGAELIKVSLPSIANCLPAYYAIAYAEASSSLSKLDGIRFGHRSENYNDIDSLYTNSRTEGFSLETQKQIIIGTYVLSSGNYDLYYKKARIVQAMLREEFNSAFSKCDIVLAPSMHNDEPHQADICTAPASLVGLPAVSVPDTIGFQFIGKSFEDADLLSFAQILEREVALKGVR